MNRQELKEKVKSLPKSSGVYIMKDNQEQVIYVGKAKILPKRVKSYFDDSPKTQKTYALVSNIHNDLSFEYDVNIIKSGNDVYVLIVSASKVNEKVKIKGLQK